MFLNELPIEMLNYIFDFLNDKTKCRLARTCRVFYSILKDFEKKDAFICKHMQSFICLYKGEYYTDNSPKEIRNITTKKIIILDRESPKCYINTFFIVEDRIFVKWYESNEYG